MKIQDIVLRSSSVKRWHTVATLRQQSLAEHQYNVAHILLEFCDRAGIDYKDYVLWALTHDLHEIIDGDTPTSAKKKKKPEKLGLFKLRCKIADTMEALVFIRVNKLDRHGAEAAAFVSLRYQDLIVQATSSDATTFNNILEDITTGDLTIERRS